MHINCIFNRDNLDNVLLFNFSRCIVDIHEGVEKLLKYVKSIKRLGSIRDSIYELLSKSRLFCSRVSLPLFSFISAGSLGRRW